MLEIMTTDNGSFKLEPSDLVFSGSRNEPCFFRLALLLNTDPLHSTARCGGGYSLLGGGYRAVVLVGSVLVVAGLLFGAQ